MEKELTQSELEKCHEIGYILTQIFKGSTYDKETTYWDFSGCKEMTDDAEPGTDGPAEPDGPQP